MVVEVVVPPQFGGVGFVAALHVAVAALFTALHATLHALPALPLAQARLHPRSSVANSLLQLLGHVGEDVPPDVPPVGIPPYCAETRPSVPQIVRQSAASPTVAKARRIRFRLSPPNARIRAQTPSRFRRRPTVLFGGAGGKLHTRRAASSSRHCQTIHVPRRRRDARVPQQPVQSRHPATVAGRRRA